MKKIVVLVMCLAALPLAAREVYLRTAFSEAAQAAARTWGTAFQAAQEAKAPPPYKIAFIRFNHHSATRHLKHILTTPGLPVKLVGIAETERELVAEAKRRGATVPFWTDYNKMLDEVKPDIVFGLLENGRHLEIVRACAPRKIHVIFQKPLASSYEDALAIQALARKHGIQVVTDFDIAFYPTTHAAKAKADSGEIGKVWRLHGIQGHGGTANWSTGWRRFFFQWLTDPSRNGGGPLVDFGCYNALWALSYKGRPETVYAYANHLQPGPFPKVEEDTAVMILGYKDGVGIFEGSWDLPRRFQRLEVFGLTGSILTSEDVEVVMRKGDEPEARIDVPALPPEMAGPMEYMAYCLRHNKPVGGMVALDVNVSVLEILEAARLSIKSGKAVALPLLMK